MRRQGAALTPQERRRYPAIRGSVKVNSENSRELGLSAKVACVEAGLPKAPNPLPHLLEATLAGMAVTGFVLSGIEYIGGYAYAQSWWCRIEYI